MNPRSSARRLLPASTVSLVCLLAAAPLQAQFVNPVLYVTQVPPARAGSTVTSIGGSHLPTTDAAPRGGDLMIVYPGGFRRNLTRLAGYGVDAPDQTGNAIAVRDPHLHWDGRKAVFSMVTGVSSEARWQIYEITGFADMDTPVITKVPGQPADFNNIQPAYLPDGGVVYVSDRTRDGSKQVYPAIDEQGKAPANTGIWKLRQGLVTQLEHSPSGSFEPMVDSFGRIVFSRWDHLQRDEHTATPESTTATGAFNYSSEMPGAVTQPPADLFPEAFKTQANPTGLAFDLFMPWTLQQDGSELNTVNHVGRHEFGIAFNRSRPDSNLIDFQPAPTVNNPGDATQASSFLHLSEHPLMAGRYLATDSVTTGLSAGRLVAFRGQPEYLPTQMRVTLVSNQGLSRDASWLADGRLMGSFVQGPVEVIAGTYGGGSVDVPVSIPPDFIPPDAFRIRLAAGSVKLANGTNLTTGSNVVRINYLPDGTTRAFSGELWELQPVEVRVRTSPPVTAEPSIPAPEVSMFYSARVLPSRLKAWMTEQNLALISCRNVTTRDAADRQQPVNLTVPGGVSTTTGNGPEYSVSRVQFFQADYVRGYGLTTQGSTPEPGRRTLAVPMHEGLNSNPPVEGPPASVQVSTDGSMASFVPARRGVSWHLTSPEGESIVKERYWLSFKAGEVRTCTSCHGVNATNQTGGGIAANAPQALQSLLTHWKSQNPEERTATHYQIWSELTAPAASAPEEDTDGDGITNLVEYAIGSNPLQIAPSASAVAPAVTMVEEEGSRYPVVRFSVSGSADSRLFLETSTDMKTWETAAVAENTGTCEPSTGYTVTVRTDLRQAPENLVEYEVRGTDAMADRPRFFRLRVVAE